jgi:hypothetical protein
MNGAIPVLPLYAFMAWIGKTLPFYLYLKEIGWGCGLDASGWDQIFETDGRTDCCINGYEYSG